MFSSIDELLEDGETLEETRHPARLDSRYVMGFGGSIVLVLVAAAMFVVWGSINVVSVAAFGAATLFFIAFEVRRIFVMYHFTSKKVVKEIGVFNKDIYSIPYSHIIEVAIEQDVEERIFGVADLHIKTAGTDSTEMILHGMKESGKYKRFIGERISGDHNESMGQAAPAQPRGEGQDQEQTGGVSLESELGRISLRKKELQERYENGELSEQEYRKEWYRLEGAEEEVLSQMERSGEG